MEKRQGELEGLLADPAQLDGPGRLQEVAGELAAVEAELESCLERWEALETKKEGS